MTVRFRFRFRPGELPIDIAPAELAEANPALARLRAHLQTSATRAGLVGEQASAMADHALAGFIARCLRSYGEAYLARVMSALDRVYAQRAGIATELDKILRGESADFSRIRNAFHEIDTALPEILSPEASGPPRIAPTLAEVGGVATPTPSTLGEFLGRVRGAAGRLSSAERALLDRADGASATALRRLLLAEAEGSLRPGSGSYDTLVAALRERGFSPTEIVTLIDTVGRLNEAWRRSDGFVPEGRRAQIEAALADLGHDALPDTAWLRNSIRRNPSLRALLMSNAEQLRGYWRAYRSRWRPYGFALYVWFNMHHVRGGLGEWSAAFDLGRSGVLIFLKGPKPEVTTGGTDLVAIDRHTGQVYAIDNKATLRTRVLDRVTALMRNFPQNLAADIRELRAAAGDHPEPAIESVMRRLASAESRIRAVVDLLGPEGEARKRALDADVDVTLPSGERRPVQGVITEILQESGVTRLITNAGGVLELLSQALEDAGIELENLNETVTDSAAEATE
jgi:hypothetical protein